MSVTAKERSKEPCIVCESTKDTALCRVGKQTVVLCPADLYKKVPEPKKKKEVTSGSEATTRKSV
jgi:ferredoxin-like protein FixX